MKIAMLVSNSCIFETRVIKEATALAESGHSVSVLCVDDVHAPSLETKNGVTFIRFPRWHSVPSHLSKGASLNKGAETPRNSFGNRSHTDLSAKNSTDGLGLKNRRFSLGKSFVAFFKLIMEPVIRFWRRGVYFIFTPSVLKFLKYRRMFVNYIVENQYDVVHAHDLCTLPAGVAAKRKSGVILIYDSHELEMHRKDPRSIREKWLRHKVETYCIRKSDKVITVCESIANYLKEAYQIAKPFVIYNGPDVQNLEPALVDVRRAAGLLEDTPLGVYVGVLSHHRGLEHCVRALPLAPEIHLAMVGPRRPLTEAVILNEAKELGVYNRLHLIDAVNPNQVTSFIRTADFSLVPTQNTCLSYYFSLPNKLFESVLAGLPVGGARLAEIEHFIEKTKTGIIMDETDPRKIAEAMRELYRRRNEFRPNQETQEAILQEYGWETQKKKLNDIYNSLAMEENSLIAQHSIPA